MSKWTSAIVAGSVSMVLLCAALATAATPVPAASPAASKAASRSEAKGENAAMPTNPHVVIVTSLGDIEVELYADKAPETVKNFLSYAESGHYDGTIFHRVIKNFMIQGGGFTPDMQQKPTKAPIKNEAGNGLKNQNGTIAMARTNVVDSATAQFFINVKDNEFLDHKNDTPQGFGYAVFGKVVSGDDVVKKIENVSTTNKGMYQDVPADPVVIKAVKIKK